MSDGVFGNAPSGGSAVLAEAERVLRQNWVVGSRGGTPFAYTEPSPGRYPWQWYWDSCFAAIVWRRFEPARARAELESLLAAQRPDGFIGHTIFWRSHVSWLRLLFYNVAGRRAEETETIQPPLLAWAWRIAVGDPAEEPRIARHLDWLARNRELEGDGLLWIVQPDESGLDASPKFEEVWGRRANGRIGFPLLVRRNRRLGWDARRIREAGGPVLCEPLVNTLWSLSLRAAGRPSATPALVDRLWDERRGLFLDETQPGGLRPRTLTWASLAPLALPDLPEEIGRRLVEEHLLNASEFLTPVAPPSVAVGERGYEPDDGRGPIRRYWRGPTWVNSAWMVWLGLRRLGYAAEAERLADGVIGAAAREGLREYYDPRNGKGMGAKDFAWSALVAELADPEPL
jgi:Mannosylglycerate hydrolase MGH1-like glycoside hydrolase domain